MLNFLSYFLSMMKLYSLLLIVGISPVVFAGDLDEANCPANEIYVPGNGCMTSVAWQQKQCQMSGGSWFVHDSGGMSCVFGQSEDSEDPGIKRGTTQTERTPRADPACQGENQPESCKKGLRSVDPAAPHSPKAAVPAQKPEPGTKMTQEKRALRPDGTPMTDEEQAAMRDQATIAVKELEEQVVKCTTERKDAQSCCRQPMSCLTGRDNPEIAGAMQTLTALIGTGAAVALGAQQGGSNPGMQACKTMQMLGLGSAGINGLAGTVCTSRKLSCDSTCGEVVTKASAYITANCTVGSTDSVCSRLKTHMMSAKTSIQECGYLNANIQQLGSQTIAGLSGTAIASLCNQMSASSVGFANLDKPPVFTGDCSNPANASNPACVNCTGTNATTNPLCNTTNPNTVGLGDGGTNLAKANYGASAAGGATSNVAGLEGADTQAPVTPFVQAEANKNSGIQGGGGGGLGAAGASANNDPGGGQGGGGGGGVNADIMQGTSGGNGFSGYASAPQTGGGDGGFSGYGGGTGSNRGGSGFNLAQYLPGGAKAAAGRGLAGASGIIAAKAELGDAKDNIWIRPTRRMGIMCQQNRLDCGVK